MPGTPRYLVTIPPGAPVVGVGFVRAGDIFAAPDGFVPSRTFRPVNQEAADELRKLKSALQENAKALRSTDDKSPEDIRSDRKKAQQLEADAASIVLELFEPPRVETPVEEGVTLAQLGRMSQAEAPAKGAAPKPPQGKPGGDRKL